MPWCEPCDAFYNPNTLRADGSCPRCGAQVGDPAAVVTDTDRRGGDQDRSTQPHAGAASADSTDGDEYDEDELVAKVPWHFWVGVVAMVVYLGWRFLQGIIWFF
ncbi:MAG: hypothetical protein ACE367_03375 [Acidimicrobiales bacterium]